MRLIRGDGRVIEYALAPHNLDIKPSAAPGKQQSPEESDEGQSAGHPYGDSHRYRHQRDDDEGRQGGTATKAAEHFNCWLTDRELRDASGSTYAVPIAPIMPIAAHTPWLIAFISPLTDWLDVYHMSNPMRP